MRYTELMTRTLRSEQVESITTSHNYMVRSGMISQVASGIYSYLPLGWRSLQKVEAIIRQEMDSVGAQEIRMPVLQPMEMWKESGRFSAFGDNLMTLQDRHGRGMVMAPTHEEIVTQLAKNYVQSYRDLPIIIYQIQTKFRDEARPRAGLIRCREFDMKDAYSLESDYESLEQTYRSVAEAYKRIFERCGIPALMVEADSGAIGGKDSHEFVLPNDNGEDSIIICNNCGYAANLEKASSTKDTVSDKAPLLVEEISTPDIRTITDLSDFLGVDKNGILKTVIYKIDGKIILTVIRGDLEINETKLKNYLKGDEISLASDQELGQCEIVAGSASPIGTPSVTKIADHSILLGSNFVAGANKLDKHLINVNYPRDFKVDEFADIANAKGGDICSNCGDRLKLIQGIEVGHIFKLGILFSEKFGVYYLDDQKERKPVVMGCYGIGIGRLLSAIIEENHDDKGIMFPLSIAPYQVHLVGLNLSDSDVLNMCDDLYLKLLAIGVECLYDDRVEESAGVKFNDSDLLGLPIRLVVSSRTIKEKSAEIKMRADKDSVLVSLDQSIDKIKAIVSGPG